MKNLLMLTLILAASVTATAGTKRKPASAPNIPCLNAVNHDFHVKWDPVHDQIRTEANDLNEKERRNLHNESRRLLLAKAEAIKTCNSNPKNLNLNKILQPFK